MKNSAIGSNWKDVRAELFTKEEILESDLLSHLSNCYRWHQEKISQLETLKKKLLQDMFI